MDPAHGKLLFNTRIVRKEDNSLMWEQDFREEIEDHEYITCVMKAESNLEQKITWHCDTDLAVSSIVTMNTENRRAASER